MFTTTDINTNTPENTWFTPKSFFNLIDGEFDTDPCSMSFRPFNIAKKTMEYDKGDNGLLLDWSKCGRMFINPPYGKEIIPFIEKFINERPDGIMLIFARMGSKGVQDLLNAGAYCFLLRKRISFVSKIGNGKANAGTDSALFFFNESEIQNIFHEGILIKAIPNKINYL